MLASVKCVGVCDRVSGRRGGSEATRYLWQRTAAEPSDNSTYRLQRGPWSAIMSDLLTTKAYRSFNRETWEKSRTDPKQAGENIRPLSTPKFEIVRGKDVGH